MKYIDRLGKQCMIFRTKVAYMITVYPTLWSSYFRHRRCSFKLGHELCVITEGVAFHH